MTQFTSQRSNKDLIEVAIQNGYLIREGGEPRLTKKGDELVNALPVVRESGFDSLEIICICMDAMLEAMKEVEALNDD